MKNLVRLALILVMMSYQSFVAQEKTRLIVEFERIKNTSGTLHVGVFEKENFLKKPTLAKSIEVKGSTHTVEFENLDFGVYAISVFQDLNANQSMDMQSNGIPLEPWTMSGHPNPFAAPFWEDVKFTFDQKKKRIKLKI
ncbi:DUF2141 domain-containing protein [Psychroflexus sediminis]|uniref:Uncharacterized conserved protein, DUF2141 family n=1 Tax=Psychroflexus sediminis TaxID=470826 RepID=A0A1G7WCQ2_9FLAO|nr:DUF2141 domain-containing protein [Psychroflexus sediminis]SDG69738.1 Uncharacterized conserved protein, DUF2141 family [Psychroflexus sediminis]